MHLSTVRNAVLMGTLVSTMIATNALPALTPEPGMAQAGPRHGQSQNVSAERKKGGKKNQRNVTKTFSSDAAVSVPGAGVLDTFGPADPYPSAIAVFGIKQGRVVDVNLTLRGLSHGFPADLNLMLIAPDGRNAIVMSDVGEVDGDDAVTDLTITLDDEALAPLPEDGRLTSGSFRPTDGDIPGPSGELDAFPAPAPGVSGATALSIFDGGDPNGTWQLFILDDDNLDTGAVARGWSLEITASTKTKSQNKKGKR
jgi:subtilisin-like proprotein convertase family protein